MPIDHNYIRAILERFEGKGIARGYVPSKNGVPLGVSGVTIGTGVDLGQQTGAGLMDMGVDYAIVKKLLPYIGLKKLAAVDALKRQPLTLTAAEVKTLDDAVIGRYVRNIEARYNKDKPTYHFADIPPEAQAVVVSLLYHRGLASPKSYPNTWALLIKGDWLGAAAKLCNSALWKEYKTRRVAEGNLLKQIKPAQPVKDSKK